MEVVAAAASIVTLVDITKQVFSSCNEYVLDVKHARQEIKDLSAEVLGLRDTLQELDELLKSPSASKMKTLQLLGKPNGAFEQCKNQLKDLLSELGAVDTSRRTSRLKWPFKKEKVNSSIEALQRHKSSIQLALDADHM